MAKGFVSPPLASPPFPAGRMRKDGARRAGEEVEVKNSDERTNLSCKLGGSNASNSAHVQPRVMRLQISLLAPPPS